MRHPGKPLLSLGPQEPRSVRDDSNPQHDSIDRCAPADFGYFDENQDGKITRKEFVEKPSAFILRFDRNGDCRVTGNEIRAANAP